MDNILALDQSSRVSGFAVFSDGQLKDYGTFICDQEDLGDRLVAIRTNILGLIKKYDINCVIFEDIQQQGNVANNIKTFKILAEVFGLVYELVTELELENYCALAVTWKADLKIKGKSRAEQKQLAQQFVLDNYNIKATQDEADAICIGTYLMHQRDGISWY